MDLRELPENLLRKKRTAIGNLQQIPPIIDSAMAESMDRVSVGDKGMSEDLQRMPVLTPQNRPVERTSSHPEVTDLNVSKNKSHVAFSITSSMASKSSQIRRRERALELERLENLAKLDEMFETEAAERREAFEAAAYERKRRLAEMRFQKEKDDLLDELQDEEDDGRSSISNMRFPTPAPEEKVDGWLDRSEKASIASSHSKSSNSTQKPTQMEELIKGLGKAIADAQQPKDNSSDMKIWIARQSMGKDLPIFAGRPEEWPTFEIQFRTVSETCKYTNDINMQRLQKALRGPAREAVQAMMYSPDNLELVMKTLKQRFGRPDHIIDVLIDKAKGTFSPKESDMESLITFSNAVMNLAMTMESLRRPHHLHNPQLLKELVGKLPPNLRLKWGRKVSKSDLTDLNIKDFALWMDTQATAASFISQPKSSKQDDYQDPQHDHNHHPKPQKRKDVVFTAVNRGGETKEYSCTYCEVKGHIIFRCEKYKNLNLDERWEWVTKTKACYVCLRKGHLASTCKTTRKCESCGKSHNTLLHREMKSQNNYRNETVSLHTVEPARLGKKILLSIRSVILKGPKGEISTYAFFDEGSTCSMLDASIAKRLGLKGTPDPISLQWTGDITQEDRSSERVSLQISENRTEEFYDINNIRTMKSLNLPIQTVDYKRMAARWNHLKKVNLDSLKDAQPTILLGQDNIHLIVAREVIEETRNSPMLTRTKLGWVVHGNVSTVKGRVDSEVSFHICERDQELHQLVKEYFSTESFGVKVMTEKPRSKEDKRAQQIFDETTRYVGHRWETGLLWRDAGIKLPESKQMAMKRLFQLEKKLDSNQQLANQYYKKMEYYLEKGYTRKLTPDEVARHGPRLWYLPHFAATHPNKPGKIRLVFDAAAKSNGTSLNDNFYTGPDLLNSLAGVLFKFRQRKIAFTGDIQEMFHQVQMKKEDLDAQRFLWRGRDRAKEPDVMEISVMTFGSACSPFSAQSVKNLKAEELKEEFPAASNAIIKKHYMDDYLDSVDDEETAIKLIQEVSKIHTLGGFKIRSWTSNSSVVLDSIPDDLRAEPVKTLNDQSVSVARVLGIRWQPDVDQFTFTINLNRTKAEILDGRQIPTKREVLRLVMSIFDPVGFVSHLTVKAKIILRDVWKCGIGWDDELTNHLQEKWICWVKELESLTDVQIPRCYSSLIPTAESIQLHILCDASEQAFAAVAYLRIQKGDEIDVAFVSSKTRVAPVRPMSIPRLELQAAVLGSRLSTTIREEHEIKIDTTHYWTDSMTVISWLKAEGKTFKTFVAHRIGEIEDLTEITKWHWVPTKLNVADDATRDFSPTDLSPEGRWFTGPEFLKNPESEWPQQKNEVSREILTGMELEIKEVSLFIVIREPLIEVFRFSSYKRLKRTAAWVNRFITKVLKRGNPLGPLTCKELEKAEKILWRESQRCCFPEELKTMAEGKSIPGSSRLAQLSPFIDEEAILRIDSRIKNADVDNSIKLPVILDPKNQISKLIIEEYHRNAHHNGQEHVLNEIRQTFWILHARSQVRKIWRSCQICKNRGARPEQPEMAALPAFRVQGFVRPFTHTGVDYFGPMEVTVGRRREKRYGCLFTCLTTRAVHLEIASNLTTDSCIMAIQRMIARRGNPTDIYSDNGTNFRGADRELRSSIKELDGGKLVTTLGLKGIQWHFNPPAAPHFGGSWERLVRSIKTALRATLNEQAPKEEVLITLMLEAESLVNSRPLTHVSIDPKDPESLTPNHFLLGTSSPAQPFGSFSEDDLCLRKNWRKAQRLADQFWRRWMKEYLPTLTKRDKWHKKANPIKVGDVVMIADPDFPRNVWPRGIITKTFPGSDGQVRVVDVKTAMGTFKRPVCKIAVLDVQQSAEE